MAAVDPSESPHEENYPVENVNKSEGRTEAVESGCSSNQKDEKICNNSPGSPDDVRRASVESDGGCVASHCGASVESVVATDKTTFNLPEVQTSAEVASSDQRAFDCPEAEDNVAEPKPKQEEHDKCDSNNVTEGDEKLQEATCVDAVAVKEEPTESLVDHNYQAGELVGAADGVQDVVKGEEVAEQGEDTNLAAKQKKCRLVCKECGEVFNRRETYNLHRHFHAHKDELTPLTCKECGLTFPHRSSLIKHRNVHKVKEEELLTPKTEVQTKEEVNFECAECGRIFLTVDKLRDHNCSNTVKKPFHCPLCRQDFQYKVSVTRHMLTHSEENVLTCQVCNQTCRNIIALHYHQRCHSALKPYECPECGMVFKHYSVMEDHRRKHVDNTHSQLCNICGKTFKYSSLLHQHQYLHTGQKPFRCPECGKKFAFAQNMKAHCRQHRLRETNSSSERLCNQAPVKGQDPVKGLGKENSDQSDEPKCSFKCPLCPETLNTVADLKVHLLIHERAYESLEKYPRQPREMNQPWEKGHTCPHCPSVYRDEASLNNHLLSVHKSVAYYLEKMAARPKKQSNRLSSDNIRGKRRSDGISLKCYKCSECGKSFRHRSVLELHMRIHSKDKPYQCKVCGKGFRFSSYLQQHLIIHTGKKPYQCPDCGKDFAFLQNMKTHQKLHQEKPFRCTSCRKGYSDETQLQLHMLSHNGDKPHKCDQCDKSFGLAYLLRDHMNTHTGERPHRCDECNKTFSWFSSLLVHQKIHARKRQSLSQHNSFSVGGRMRGRGRRGGRFSWGWSRPLGGSGMGNSQPTPAEPQSSMLSSCMDLQSRQQKEPWTPELQFQPVQWKVDGGEVMPVSSSQRHRAASQQPLFDGLPQPGLQQNHQRSSDWAVTQTGTTPAQSSESSHVIESAASTVSTHSASVPKKSSPLAVCEMEQHMQPKQPLGVTWSNTPASKMVASTSSLQQDLNVPCTYADGAALWSVRPTQLADSQGSPNKLSQEHQMPRWPGAPMSTQKEPPKSPKKEEIIIPSTVSQQWNGCEQQKQWASTSAGVSTSSQIDQSSAIPVSTPASLSVGSTLWELKTPPGIPKAIDSPDKLVNNQDFQLQQKQVSSGWANVQSQTVTQKVPISIQYEPHRFGPGVGTSVWSFQSNPVGTQTLLTGQLKPGNGQELQQQPMVTGTQIIINQPSPFFSPPLAPLPPLALTGPRPLHSVAVGALPGPPHPNIFFTSQAVMSEKLHVPQTRPLPRLAVRKEPHKPGSHLSFSSEGLLQCMICGCSLLGELDLQMHYLQHAQEKM